MTEQPTKKYKSPVDGRECKAPHYIADLMCSRMAHKKGEHLTDKYWNTSNWESVYKQQLIAVHGLLKIHDESAIVAALHSKEGQRIYSLRAPQLDRLIGIESERIKKLESRDIEIKDYNVDINTKPRKPFGKQSGMSRLRDLDNSNE